MSTLTMAWPKQDRPASAMLKRINQVGLNLNIPSGQDFGQLTDTKNSLGDIQIEKARPRDAFADLVETRIDIAIMGSDKVAEYNAKFDLATPIQIVAQTKLAECRLSIASGKNIPVQSIRDLEGLRIATSYPNVLKRELDNAGVKADIIERDGTIELFVSKGRADAAFDIVETGGSLKRNNLVERLRVMSSNLVLCARSGLNGDQEKQVELLGERLLSFREGNSEPSKIQYIPQGFVGHLTAHGM